MKKLIHRVEIFRNSDNIQTPLEYGGRQRTSKDRQTIPPAVRGLTGIIRTICALCRIIIFFGVEQMIIDD